MAIEIRMVSSQSATSVMTGPRSSTNDEVDTLEAVSIPTSFSEEVPKTNNALEEAFDLLREQLCNGHSSTLGKQHLLDIREREVLQLKRKVLALETAQVGKSSSTSALSVTTPGENEASGEALGQQQEKRGVAGNSIVPTATRGLKMHFNITSGRNRPNRGIPATRRSRESPRVVVGSQHRPGEALR